MLLTDLIKHLVADVYPDFDPKEPLQTYNRPLEEEAAKKLIATFQKVNLLENVTVKMLLEDPIPEEYAILKKRYSKLTPEEKDLANEKIDDLVLKIRDGNERASALLLRIYRDTLNKIASKVLSRYSKIRSVLPSVLDLSDELALRLISKVTGINYADTNREIVPYEVGSKTFIPWMFGQRGLQTTANDIIKSYIPKDLRLTVSKLEGEDEELEKRGIVSIDRSLSPEEEALKHEKEKELAKFKKKWENIPDTKERLKKIEKEIEAKMKKRRDDMEDDSDAREALLSEL